MTVFSPSMFFSDPPASHIAVVLHDFSSGGSERIAIRLANRWASVGRRVTILCGTEAGPARDQVDPAVDVRAMMPSIPRGRNSRARLGRALARLLDEIAPDVVFGPGNFHVSVLRSMRIAATTGCPATVSKLSNSICRTDRGRLPQFIFEYGLRFRTRRLDAVVAMSPALAEEAQLALGRADIGWLAQPNIDDDWTPARSRPSTGTIVCAGRLIAQKNFALALDAVARLGGEWTLELLGDGKDRGALERQARALGLSGRVNFRGQVPDIAPFLARADAFLCTSRFEGFPGALIEALAAGVPVVTTRCSPAIAEIMIDLSFGIVAPTDPNALATALRRVLAGPRPDGERLTTLLDRHRVGSAAEAWLALLDRVVADKRRWAPAELKRQAA